jgi:hypothetical protein
MGWEARRNRRYYYSKRRQGARVISQYLGPGDAGLLGELMVALDQRDRRRERRRREQEQRAAAELDRAVIGYFRVVDRIVAEVLGSAGYWRPGRRWWRKRRMSTSTNTSEIQPAAAGSLVAPFEPGILGDMATIAADAMLGELSNNKRFTKKEVAEIRKDIVKPIRAEFEYRRAELAGPSPSPLERLLADRVAVCWLHATLLTWYASRSNSGTSAVAQRQLDRAAWRLALAARTLAQVRRLQVPIAVQVNAEQAQVNIALDA